MSSVWILILATHAGFPLAQYKTQGECEQARDYAMAYTQKSNAQTKSLQCIPILGDARIRLPN